MRITQPPEERIKLDQQWKSFAQAAKQNDVKFQDPLIPFRDDVVLCDFNSVYRSIYDKEKYNNS